MKTNSRSKINITNQYVTDNCDCFCHYPEDMEMNEQHSILHQNLPSSSNTQAYRQTPLKKNTIPKKNAESLCMCDVYVVHVSKKKRMIIIKIYILK